MRLSRALLSIPLLLLAVGCPSSSDPLLGTTGCPALVVFSPTEVDTNATLIQSSEVAPEYPEAARVAMIEGTVLLTGVVSDRGAVCSLLPLTVDPEGLEFEDAAIAAVMQWRYDPATRNGDNVAVVVTVQVDFTLN
ncbi:MAG: energy transducer TonB [Acidobacteriota bacterium]|nr:energy transducer TonB [Acidobacteriota bacterium]